MTTLDFWENDFTPEVIALAKSRVRKGGNLFTRTDLDRETIKLALILVRQLNPMEELTMGEQAILMGVSKNTVTAIYFEKRLVNIINR
jgi:hypothetical protein